MFYEIGTPKYEAFWEGYDAGVEFHLGSGVKADPPSHLPREERDAWIMGFDQAGDDS